MNAEQQLKQAENLARELRDVDDNEVKKIYGFLCKEKNITALHKLIEGLPNSPFKRTKRTEIYYTRIKEVIPRFIRKEMGLHDALQILGWALRLLKYEAIKNGESKKTQPKGKNFQGGKKR